MKDLIERRATIETLKKLLYETALVNSHDATISDVYAEMAENRIETWVNLIPPAPQEQPAEWVPSTKYKGFLTCSACEDCYIEGWSDKERKWRYCPQCGKRMRGKLVDQNKLGGEHGRCREECDTQSIPHRKEPTGYN